MIGRIQQSFDRRAGGAWRKANALVTRFAGSDFVQKVSETYATRIAGIAIGLVTSVIVARLLGPAGRGQLAVAVALSAIGVQFGNLGLASSNTYFVAKDRCLLGVLLGNSLLVAFALGLVFSGIVHIVLAGWPHLAPIEGLLLTLALALVPLGLSQLLLQNLLLGIQRVRQYNLIEIGTRLLTLVLVVALLLLQRVTPENIFSVSLLLFAASTIGCGLLLRPRLVGSVRLSLPLLREHLVFAVRAYLAALFAFLTLRSDLLLVQHFLGPRSAGHYSIAAGLADMLYLLPATIAAILFPHIAQVADRHQKWAFTRRVTVGVFIALVPLVAVAIVLARPIITLLYGPAFLPAVASARILCAAMLFYGLNTIVTTFTMALGFPWFAVHVWWIGFVMNVAANLWLIPAHGIEGAATASLGAYFVIFVLNLAYALKRRGGVQVERDFDALYKQEADPWSIGDASHERYDLYLGLVNRWKRGSSSMLDIGCGQGAVLNRFKDSFQRLTGIELSAVAIAKGQQRFPRIEFRQGSADRLDAALDADSRFDAILYSDVICYLDEDGKKRSLDWIHDHLTPTGIALVAAWCPGGQYLEPGELRRLVRRRFSILHERTLPSQHAIFALEPRRRFVAITVDYETWHPVPVGKRIDWEADVFEPFRRLLSVATDADVKLTVMAEMAEYFWLDQNEPRTARAMEEQWREAVRRGHDVQLHLHPCWLPSLGAHRDGDQWSWDWSKAKADDYPGDLDALILQCKETLERLLRPERDSYRVTCFRAGAYQAQPFRRLGQALARNGIRCDSSVFRGGLSSERGYDYRSAYADHNPWFASPYDPQLKAVPSETQLVELPIFTPRPAERWFLDGTEGPLLAPRLLVYLKRTEDRRTTESLRRLRALKSLAGLLYGWLKPTRGVVNRLLPAGWADWLTEYPREELTGHDYFVLIGHTKGEHDWKAIGANLRALRDDPRLTFLTLSEMATTAREDLRALARASREEEARYQVEREFSAVMGAERNAAQSYELQKLLPWGCDTLLDLGCGSGYWSERIARMHPWIRVTGVDFGQAFIEKARELYRLPNLDFAREDFGALSFAEASFDVVYADNTIEHAFDVDLTLGEVLRVLRPGGTLVAALPPDGANAYRTCDNHTWKTLPDEVRSRLLAAGFEAIRIRVRDTYRELGMAPYPPSGNRMMYILARKPESASLQTLAASEASAEVMRIMGWLYERVQPADLPEAESEPSLVLSGRKALCLGYALTLGRLLEREGYPVEYVTLVARDHERGRGPAHIDSHEVLQVHERDGARVVLDPMTNRRFPYSLLELLQNPSLAAPRPAPDTRYCARRYDLYDTSYFYERAFEACVRRSPDVQAYDSEGSWRAWLKAAAGLGRRTIYSRRGADPWRRVLLPLDPRARIR